MTKPVPKFNQNDPQEVYEQAIRIDELKRVADMFLKAVDEHSCGCPESRLCNHEAEIAGYETAESMVFDLIEQRKKGINQ